MQDWLERDEPMIRRAFFRELAGEREGPAISLYMPTFPAGRDMRKDAIRLKNLLNEAESRIGDRGLFERLAEPLLPLAAAREEPWKEMRQGLVALLAQDRSEVLKLPQRVEEQVWVGPRFLLRPLLPFVGRGQRFFLLAADQRVVTLYAGNRAGLWVLRENAFEESYESILARTELPDEVAFHTAGAASAYHAAGEAKDDYLKRALSRYAQGIAKVVDEELAGETDPLVLAAEPRLLGLLRQWIGYRHVADEAIAKDPCGLSEDELFAQARAIVAPLEEQALGELLERYHGADAAHRADRPEALLKAAAAGAVEELLLPESARLYGRFDVAHGVVRLDPERRADSDDLVDLAIHLVLVHGGEVRLVPDARWKAGAPFGALLRYAVPA